LEKRRSYEEHTSEPKSDCVHKPRESLKSYFVERHVVKILSSIDSYLFHQMTLPKSISFTRWKIQAVASAWDGEPTFLN
jgi:hypothetical protein